MKIQVRDVPPRSVWALQQAGIHPLLAQLYAARGVNSPDELDDGLARLLPPAGMLGTQAAASTTADAFFDTPPTFDPTEVAPRERAKPTVDA